MLHNNNDNYIIVETQKWNNCKIRKLNNYIVAPNAPTNWLKNDSVRTGKGMRRQKSLTTKVWRIKFVSLATLLVHRAHQFIVGSVLLLKSNNKFGFALLTQTRTHTHIHVENKHLHLFHLLCAFYCYFRLLQSLPTPLLLRCVLVTRART